MPSLEQALLFLILLVGIVLISVVLIRIGFRTIGIPDVVGYIALGLILQGIDQTFHLFSDGEREVLAFLADIGIISLLFRVGLESKLDELMKQMRSASLIWLSDIGVSGVLGFGTAYWLLNLELFPSLFVGVALTATSVGISVSLWRDQGALQSPNGELMLDVAEMDDISAVIVMGLLFAVVPVVQNNPDTAVLPIVGKTVALFFFKAIIFGAFCYLFSRYAERAVTQFSRRITPSPDPIIMVTGIGFITAALAGVLGFSVAIGAFFAGLVFSRDPQSVKLDASFGTIYELFMPFFFIGIGLQIDLTSLGGAFDMGGVLLIAAVLGKFIGVGSPVMQMRDKTSALLLGVSMVPRAEITMIVMQHGLQFGDWAVTPQVFSAMILVSMVTMIGVPLVLNPMLQRWPQTE